ncbi:hypothetical protein FHG87_008105 [Trinorchestia longiramus]|nr:hypothetical protein FHG87_008105 [Trinorchestia longiramus]
MRISTVVHVAMFLVLVHATHAQDENPAKMASVVDQPASSLADWSAAFLHFLNDSNYNRPGQPSELTMRNLTNLYNLLFVPEQRGEHQTVFGPPPAADAVVEYLLAAGDLITLQNEKISFPQQPQK